MFISTWERGSGFVRGAHAGTPASAGAQGYSARGEQSGEASGAGVSFAVLHPREKTIDAASASASVVRLDQTPRERRHRAGGILEVAKEDEDRTSG
jgi:hypothetical protein